jgi:peptidyl-prolyl cis-trans isomerase SurA
VLKSNVIPVRNVNEKTILFYFAKTNRKAGDWFPYARTVKTTSPDDAKLPYPDLLEKFTILTGREYYRNHLEDYNPEFKRQLNEFKEGNLLFEVMERQVWSKAAADTAGTLAYYKKNKNKYQWGPSADAIFFTTSDRQTAEEVMKNVKDIARSWRIQADVSNGKILADSARFEISQIPTAKGSEVIAQMVTPMVVNNQDSSATFVYVIRTYSKPEGRSFEEAKGMVINDYQSELEKRWIATLKKKYPVTVNEAVIRSLVKK